MLQLRIISYPNFFVSAHEDKMIRVFDNNRMTHSFIAHDDSVMGLAMLSNRNEFFSCSHDATVKLWDIRKFEALQTLRVHSKKYDEAIHCIVSHPQMSIAASGGADATIKLFVPQ
jgi:WD40 repeat protein